MILISYITVTKIGEKIYIFSALNKDGDKFKSFIEGLGQINNTLIHKRGGKRVGILISNKNTD